MYKIHIQLSYLFRYILVMFIPLIIGIIVTIIIIIVIMNIFFTMQILSDKPIDNGKASEVSVFMRLEEAFGQVHQPGQADVGSLREGGADRSGRGLGGGQEDEQEQQDRKTACRLHVRLSGRKSSIFK